MGTGNILGLLFEISADPSKAQEALDKFSAATGKSFTQTSEGAKRFNDSLLSGRESARLLSEELGLHLPRAVSGAVAEMIPAISSLGPIMLGAFAVMEIPKLVSGIRDAVQSWEGFGKAEQAAMKQAVKDTAALYGEVLSVEHELDAFGKSQAEQQALKARWAGEDADRALKTLQGAENKVREIKAEIAEAQKGAGAFAAGAGSAFLGELKVAQAQVDKLRESWKLADEQALLAQKRAAEAQKKESEAAGGRGGKDPAEAAREQVADAHKALEIEHRLREEQIKGGREAGKVAAEIAKYNAEVAASADRAALAELHFALSLEQFGIAGQRDLSFMRQFLPDADQMVQKTVHLSAARKAQIAITQEAHQVEDAFSQALKGEMGALEGLTKGTQTMVEDVTALMGNTQTAAEIRGVMDAALALEYGADAAACLFTGDAAGAAEAAEASLQYAAAAKAMFRAAGSGGGASGGGASRGNASATAGGGGGGGGGRGGSGGGGGGGQYMPPGAGPSSRGSGITINMPIYGHVFADNLQTLTNKIGAGIQNGSIKSFPVSSAPVVKGLT